MRDGTKYSLMRLISRSRGMLTTMARYLRIGLLLLAALPAACAGPQGTVPTCLSEPSADLMERWIDQLGAEDTQALEEARKKLIGSGALAFEQLLQAQTRSCPERAQRIDGILNILRGRICLAATREAIQIEIRHAEQQITQYEIALTQPANKNHVQELKRATKNQKDKLQKVQAQAADYAAMTASQYALPQPLHLELDQDQGSASPAWKRRYLGEGLCAYRPALDDSWLLPHVGMSQSGPFYRAIVAAAPVPQTKRLAATVYPLLKSAYPFQEYYVYVEWREPSLAPIPHSAFRNPQ